MNLRVINEYAWSNLFAYNMFLRPSEEEINNFSAEWTIINAPGFMWRILKLMGLVNTILTILNFSKKIVLPGGTGYTGEIKKSIFSGIKFYFTFEKNVLAMHCSANITKKVIQQYFSDYLAQEKQLSLPIQKEI